MVTVVFADEYLLIKCYLSGSLVAGKVMTTLEYIGNSIVGH